MEEEECGETSSGKFPLETAGHKVRGRCVYWGEVWESLGTRAEDEGPAGLGTDLMWGSRREDGEAVGKPLNCDYRGRLK